MFDENYYRELKQDIANAYDEWKAQGSSLQSSNLTTENSQFNGLLSQQQYDLLGLKESGGDYTKILQ